MMDLFAKIVKDFQSFTISAKTFSSHRIFDRVLNKPLYTLSNSLILENCFILSFSIMICPFHMRARSRNIYIIDPSEEKHLCRHFPISVSFSSVVSLFLLQIWITGEDRFYIYRRQQPKYYKNVFSLTKIDLNPRPLNSVQTL